MSNYVFLKMHKDGSSRSTIKPFLFLLAGVPFLLTAQPKVWPQALAENIQILEMDRLGQLYLVNDQQEVLKYTPDGQLLARYSNQQLGAVGTLDVSNPFAILVYYPNFQKAIVLNRNLTEVGFFELQDFGFWEVRSVALASDNNIWLVDPLENVLVKVNEQGKRIVQSANILQQTGKSPGILRIREVDQSVWLSTDDHQLWQYDVFAQWVRALPFQTEHPSIQVLRDRFFFLQEGMPVVARIGALREQTINALDAAVPLDGFRVREADAVILKAGKVYLYPLDSGN